MKLRRPQTYGIKNTHERLFIEDLHKIFNRNISFGSGIDTQDQNVQGKMVEIADSGLANSVIIVIHNLGYIPKFYDIKYASKATQIFDFGTVWTDTQIFLASSTANTKLRIFIH